MPSHFISGHALTLHIRACSYLLILLEQVGHVSSCVNLPQSDPIRPDVRLLRVLVLAQDLRGTPVVGKISYSILILFNQVSRKAQGNIKYLMYLMRIFLILNSCL